MAGKKFQKKDSITNDLSTIDKFNNNWGFHVGIDLKTILGEGMGTDIDLFLEEGDELLIPSEKQTIEVRGEVMSPALIHFKKGKSLKSYVSNSGGFSQKAKKSKSFVIYSNGDIKSVKNYFFFKVYPKLEPGAIIFVPSEIERKNKLSVTEVLGIATSITTLGILIQNIK